MPSEPGFYCSTDLQPPQRRPQIDLDVLRRTAPSYNGGSHLLVIPDYYGRQILWNDWGNRYYWGEESNLPTITNEELEMIRNNIPVPIDPARFFNPSSLIEQPTEQPIHQGKWPIGTIVKWDFRIEGLKNYCESIGIDTELHLMKIVKYNSALQIKNPIYIGEIESFRSESYDTKLFIKATPEECAEYERRLAKLNPCTTRPDIGVVIKYLGYGVLKGKKAIVKGYVKNNRMLICWISSAFNEVYDWNVFQICKNQEGSFIPNYERDYCSCANCHSLRPLSNVREVQNIYYCDNNCAIEAHNNYCRNCGIWHPVTALQQANGQSICQPCITRHYRACEECGGLNQIGQMQPYNNLTICQQCLRMETCMIYEYSYKPVPIYQKMPWENTRYLGIELEIETPSSKIKTLLATKIRTYLKQLTTTIKDSKKLDKLVYLKNDGSLDYGIEIVFHPFTLQAFHKFFPMKEFLKFLKENNALVKENCGMHVHVSKERITNNSLLNGKWFFYQCAPFIKKFSNRGSFNYSQFEDNKPTADPYYQPHGRRTAFNVAGSPKTLELRLFKATLDYLKFQANMQFSDCFVAYIQREGSVFLRTSTPRKIWDDFIKYAKKESRYESLLEYCQVNKI